LLVACPIQELRDPKRAIQLARDNLARLPRGPWLEVNRCWHTLGVAQYRAGNWQASDEALTRGGLQVSDGPAAFVRAMTLWQLGKKKEAREFYDGTVRWMDKNKPKDLELRRFRAEAAALLGLKDPPPRKEKKGTSPKGKN
jgi:uncharacterized protein HemY